MICVNYGEKHKYINKKCPNFRYNYQLKKLVVERNISIHKAKMIVRGNKYELIRNMRL